MNASFQFFPLLPYIYYTLMFALAALVVALAFYRRARDFVWRGAFIVFLALLLLHPVVMNEQRESLPDRPVIVVDESGSQKIGGRDKVTAEALQHIRAQLPAGADPVIIRVGSGAEVGKGDATNVFSALRNNITAIPAAQVSGTIIITDGQVHDVPADIGALSRLQPFHVVLTGKRDEFDRKVSVVSAPKYGVLNDDVTIGVRIDEYGRASGAAVTVTALQDGVQHDTTSLTPGQVHEFTFKLQHPGQNVFEFTIPEAAGELTAHNNTAPVIVNAVRDRMKVLLVSGSPHMGERAWRNLLKSDPAVDLIHFTILRSPASMDTTPQKELSLIVFPVDELFENKIQDFDLIIFDRYYQYSLLMPQYFDNISRFVKDGGAMLVAMNTEEADTAVFETSIGGMLPVRLADPAGTILRKKYFPAVTEAGLRHPATADLQKKYTAQKWGAWHARTALVKTRGESLMTAGANGDPLLVIDKVEKGRVAVLASDNIWMWSKGGKQAGPYTETLRNVAHWLMKEPELEDDFIKAEVRGSNISVSMRDIGTDEKSVTMTTPAGAEKEIVLSTRGGGWVSHDIPAEQTGVYAFARGDKKAFVVYGAAGNDEFAEVHTTEEKLKPVVTASKGSIVWFADAPDFALRGVSASARTMGGDGWLGLKENGAYSVTSVESAELIPAWAQIILILAASFYMWRRESGRK
jgi:uncharacterized membrane protein